MISLILGFILPVVVWVLLLPLKLSIKIAEKSLKHGSGYLINSYKQLDSNYKNQVNSEKFSKTTKFAKMSVKAGYEIAKFGIQASYRTVKLVIRVMDVTIHLIVWLASITSLFYTTVIVGAIACLITVALVSINIIQQNSSTQQQNTGNTSTTTGQDFMSIDWSQDFSSKLSQINDKYGVEARNWVELSILEMNTLQRSLKDNKISMAESGFMTGIKAVESGQNSLIKSAGVTTQVVPMGNPMQFDTGWQQYSPYYTSFNRNKSGEKDYYPDDFYGIGVRFSNSGTKGFIPSRTDALYDRAFASMGVSKTTDKLQFVRYVGDITNEYNGVFLEKTGYVSGLTTDSANDTVYCNAMLLIEFGETYGYGITDKTIALVKSMYAKNKDDKYSNWFYDKTTTIKGVYGMVGGNKSYPSDVDKTTDFGVVDPSGSKVQGSLFNYLVNKMPDKAKNDMLNSSGLRVYNSTPAHYMRARYDLTAFLCGVYDIWWASNALGVTAGNKGEAIDNSESNVSNSNPIAGNTGLGIDQKIVSLADDYANDTSENRLQFGYAGTGNCQDSASFVNGVLRELGYAIDGTSIPTRTVRDGNLTYVRTIGQMLEKVKSRQDLTVPVQGYSGKNIPVNKLESILKPGDILLSSNNDSQHTSIYVGRNSNGNYVLVDSVTDNPNAFTAKSNFDLTGQSYGFGYTDLESSPDASKYNYVIRLSNVAE